MKKIKDLFKKHPYIYTGLLILLIVGGFYWKKSGNQDSAENIQHKTSLVKKGTLTVSVSGSGNIIVDQSANIDPVITGTVADLAVEIGDYVKEGDFLFNIINDELDIDALNAFISYEKAKNSLYSAEISAEQADENYDKAKDEDDDDDDAYTSDELDILKEKVKLAESEAVVAQQSLTSAWKSYQLKLADTSKRKVTASVSGTVNAINIENGDDLSRTSSNNSEAPIIIGDLNTLKAQIQVNEVDIVNVEIGQKTVLTFSAIDDFELIGKISKIDSLGSSDQGVVTYDVTIDFDSSDSRIKPGMSVSASIITQIKTDTLTIPSSAIKNKKDKSYVAVMKNGQQSWIEVETGLSNDTETEILKGLSDGDEIISQTISSSNSNENFSNNNLRVPGMGGFGR